ncbi:MAG: DEAD/DEAH box helicase, partial [Paracoccaceae bacterium]
MREITFFDEGSLVAVLTTEPLGRALDYKAPQGGCFLGAFVEVPLGPRRVLGVVWGAGEGGFDAARIRPIVRVLDAAPMGDAMRTFLMRAADYTLTPIPAMLRLATRAPGLADPPGPRKVYRKGLQDADRMTDARARVMAVLAEYGGVAFTLSELAELAGVTTSVIKGLAKQGVVAEEDAPRDLAYAVLDPDLPGKALTDDQAQAAGQLATAVQRGRYGTTLLKGVTGSGKTEVYLEAVAETLRKGRQALVLLPEIALTSEFLGRVEDRFGSKPGEWHSGVT